ANPQPQRAIDATRKRQCSVEIGLRAPVVSLFFIGKNALVSRLPAEGCGQPQRVKDEVARRFIGPILLLIMADASNHPGHVIRNEFRYVSEAVSVKRWERSDASCPGRLACVFVRRRNSSLIAHLLLTARALVDGPLR